MIFQLVVSSVKIYQTAQNNNLKEILSVDGFLLLLKTGVDTTADLMHYIQIELNSLFR